MRRTKFMRKSTVVLDCGGERLRRLVVVAIIVVFVVTNKIRHGRVVVVAIPVVVVVVDAHTTRDTRAGGRV
jgi:hypothetical protein